MAEYRAQAEATLNKKSVFAMFTGSTQKYEDAAELFTKAGNAYKLKKQYDDAGLMYVKCAECHKERGETNDMINSFVEAGNIYKKSDPVKAIDAFTKAINGFNDSGRFGRSASLYKEIGEIYEADNNPEAAIDAYQNAVDMYENDNKKSTASQCLIKIANLAAQADDLAKASEIYERLGRESMESNLGKFSAKGYFLQCILCHLAQGDTVACNIKIDEFKGIDYSFGPSRECDFLEKLVVAISEVDADGYAQACADFDKITPLDPWKTSMLLKAKRNIQSQSGEGEVDLC